MLEEALGAERQAQDRVDRLVHAIREAVPEWSLAPLVAALLALRGIKLIAAVTIAAEIGDLARFAGPDELMGYLGLVPSERSTGDSVKRGGITKAGNRRARAAFWWKPHGAIAIRHGWGATSWRTSRRRPRRCVSSPGRRRRGCRRATVRASSASTGPAPSRPASP